jgi:flagellar biosynthetic protein FliR
MFSAPMYSSNMIPGNIKVIASAVIALMVFPVVKPVALADADTLLLIFIIVKEVMLGLCTGMMAYLMFVGVQLGGQIIGFQMGFGMVNAFDPTANMQMSIIAQFKNIAMLLFFISVGGHLMIVAALGESFRMVPLGLFTFRAEGFLFIGRLLGTSYETALRIVAPIFVMLLMTHVIMGIMGRLVPQLNLMIVGMPLQIGVGLTVLSISLHYFYIVFEKLLYTYFERISTLFKIFGG